MSTTSGTALITGASRGIGPHIARSMAAAGYNLVLASRSRGELEAVAAEIRRQHEADVATPVLGFASAAPR